MPVTGPDPVQVTLRTAGESVQGWSHYLPSPGNTIAGIVGGVLVWLSGKVRKKQN